MKSATKRDWLTRPAARWRSRGCPVGLTLLAQVQDFGHRQGRPNQFQHQRYLPTMSVCIPFLSS